MTTDETPPLFHGTTEEFANRFVPTGLGPAPRRHLTVLACMDARLDLFRMLGLENGDAHILRNAGGIVTDDTVRSLVFSQHALGTRHTVLVHHTDCGLHGVVDSEFLDRLEAATGQRPSWQPGGFADPFEDVRRSLAAVRSCPWLLSTSAQGFVFDVETGELIDAEATA
jgi:carbonic anhydrase